MSNVERKIVSVSAHKDHDWRKCPEDYSFWIMFLDVRSSIYENLTHEELYDILYPHIHNQWPNIKINCGACSGGGPPNSDGSGIQNKDFYLHFDNSIDEAEFILENQILVGRIV
jgi:hypothetical protein